MERDFEYVLRSDLEALPTPLARRIAWLAVMVVDERPEDEPVMSARDLRKALEAVKT